jgi:hypothetical protein
VSRCQVQPPLNSSPSSRSGLLTWPVRKSKNHAERELPAIRI